MMARMDGAPYLGWSGEGFVSHAGKARRDMGLVPGVVAITAFRAWTVAPGTDCISAVVAIARNADEQGVLRSLRLVLEPLAAYYTLQLEVLVTSNNNKRAPGDAAPTATPLGVRGSEKSAGRFFADCPELMTPPPPPPSLLALGIPQLASPAAAAGRSTALHFPSPPLRSVFK
jgi:hypothetical protein